TPGTTSDLSYQPAKRATAIDTISIIMMMMMKEWITNNCRPFHGLGGIDYPIFLGFRAAALHPSLYSAADAAGDLNSGRTNNSFRRVPVFPLPAANAQRVSDAVDVIEPGSN